VLRPGPGFGQDAPCEVEATPSRAEISQRSTAAEDTRDITRIPAYELEARARAMRAAYVHALLGRLAERVTNWLESTRRRRAEEYLARSQSHADLEARMRELERRGYVPHI
jgi:hypothetical protein